MKNFLAIYIGQPDMKNKWDALPEAEKQARMEKGVKAWHAWIERNESSIVDVGSPLGKTKSIAAKGIGDTKNAMTGYTVVKAENHEAAAALFVGHPHFAIFPGESVEVMECLPIPGM